MSGLSQACVGPGANGLAITATATADITIAFYDHDRMLITEETIPAGQYLWIAYPEGAEWWRFTTTRH